MRIKSAEEIEREDRPYRTVLDTSKLLLVYIRQSTRTQVLENLESAAQQSQDTVKFAKSLGWTDETRIRQFDENRLLDVVRSASGRLGITERKRLQSALADIKKGIVGAILAADVSRLFRDVYGADVGAFIKICREHHVIVLTLDGQVFDFNDPKNRGIEDFREEANDAANYLKHTLKMNKLRRRKGLRGGYIGVPIPAGFMLGDDKQYVPNPVWAPVIKRLLKRFRELDGDFAQLRREVVGKPLFKELPKDILKQTGYIRLSKIEGKGYAINSWQGLRNLLTNVALIGHRAFDGRIVQRNAHPSIVDEQDFWYAFDKLNDTDIEGNFVERTTRVVRYVTPKVVEPRIALLAYTRSSGETTITSTQGQVYILQPKSGALYVVKDCYSTHTNFIASIRVSALDAIFEERLLARLEYIREAHENYSRIPDEQFNRVEGLLQRSLHDDSFHFNRGGKDTASPYFQLDDVLEEVATQLVGVEESISETEKELEKTRQEIARLEREYKVTFDIMSDKELRENKEARIRLEKSLTALEAREAEGKATAEDIQEINGLLGDSRTKWGKLTLEKKQRYIRLISRSIILDELGDGWLKLTIKWTPYMGDDDTDTAILWYGHGGSKWTKEEDAIMRQFYPTGTRESLLEKLPKRSWQAIWARARVPELKLYRKVPNEYSAIPTWISLADQRIMNAYNLTLEEGQKSACWWLAEISPYACSGICITQNSCQAFRNELASILDLAA